MPSEKNATPAILPTDSATRKEYPLYRGLLLYFPRALAAVAHHSYVSNEKHNPGEPLHWSKEKSNDHVDALVRHIVEEDWVAAAWRALAQLETVLETAAGEEEQERLTQDDIDVILHELTAAAPHSRLDSHVTWKKQLYLDGQVVIPGAILTKGWADLLNGFFKNLPPKGESK